MLWRFYSSARVRYLGLFSLAIFCGASNLKSVWAGEPPTARPADAEDILQQVQEDADAFGQPAPSETHKGGIANFVPKDFKVQAADRAKIRVKLPQGESLLTPALADGKVYVGGGFHSNEFYCISAETGRPVWGAHLKDNGPSAPTYSNGTVSFTTESCTLYVVDAESGKGLWSSYLGELLITAPCVVDDKILVCYPAHAGKRKKGSAPHDGFAFAARDLKTGDPLWQSWVDEHVISSPIVDGGDVYITTFAGTLYGFDLESGKVKLARKCRATSAPIVADNAIFVTRRLDLHDAPIPIECVTKFNRQTGEPELDAIERNAVYLAPCGSRAELAKSLATKAKADDEQKNAAKRSLATGRIVKATILKKQGDPGDPDYTPGISTPAANESFQSAAMRLIGCGNVQAMQRFDGSRLLSMGDRLVNCMGGDLVSLDPLTGKSNWRLALLEKSDELGESAALPPSAAGGRLYVATRAGQLLKVNPQNGAIDGRFEIGKAASTQPILDDGRIVLGTDDGELIMLKTKDRTLTGWNQWGGNAIHSGIAGPAAKEDKLASSGAKRD